MLNCKLFCFFTFMGRGIARSLAVCIFISSPCKNLLIENLVGMSANLPYHCAKNLFIHTYLFGNLQAVQNDLSEKRVPNSWPIFVSIQLSVSRLAGKFSEKSLKKTLKEGLLMQKTSMSTSVASVLELVFISTTQGTFL